METLEKKGKGSALLPFLLFIVIYLGAGLYFQAQGVEMAFYQFPSVTAMFIALLLAFCQGKGTIDQKFTVFAKGAANENVLTMLMIYILAGAFSTVASAMGGVDATVNLGLSVIPVHFLAAGVFVISAFMGTATGTSMGTISAIVPIAVGVAEKGGLSLPLFLGACVGGAMFGDNVIKYTKDGASYIDASGKTIWTQSYEMKTPIININGDYAVIADQQGNEMYICSKEGCTGTAKTQLPITKAAVSARGVAAAVVEDSTASYIFYFKKDGESLGINIKMLLSGDGYPVDIALSPDGKQIVMSVMYMKNGALKNKVAFYDFSEIGKNVNNRFIAAFEEEFDDKMVGRIRYLNDQTVCAFSDKGLTFISVKNVIPDTNVTFVPVDEEIQSICYSDKYAAVVVDSTSGSPYRLDVYNTDGKKVTSIDFDYAYTGVLIDGDRLILYNEESCREYNLDGHERFNGQFDFSVSLVRAGKNRTNSLITAGSEVMKEIKLR